VSRSGFKAILTGGTGLLGGYLIPALQLRGADVLACGGPGRATAGLDLADQSALAELFQRMKPEVVIHTAALSAIADCARDPDLARRVNVEGTLNVARAAEAVGSRLVHVSTDLVFDGEHAPYDERAEARPCSVYGATKLAAETEALSTRRAVVVRVSLLFGPTRTARRGFFDQQLESLRAGAPLSLFEDEWRTPLSLRGASESLAAIAVSEIDGLLHLGGPERMSRYEMGVRLARVAGCSAEGIARASRTAAPGERRPRDVSLDSSLVHRAVAPASGSFEEECERMLRALA
jgi:dTDP-4-dehydrorhamnose reductase